MLRSRPHVPKFCAGLTVVTGEVMGAVVLQTLRPATDEAASANSLFDFMAIGLSATGVAAFSEPRPSAAHAITQAMTLTIVNAAARPGWSFWRCAWSCGGPGRGSSSNLTPLRGPDEPTTKQALAQSALPPGQRSVFGLGADGALSDGSLGFWR